VKKKDDDWESLLTPDKDYKYRAGEDIADCIGLSIVMLLVLLVVFI
jgi:hypothetical protein